MRHHAPANPPRPVEVSRRRLSRAAVACGLLVLLASGCATGPGPGPVGDEPLAAGADVVLELWYMPNGSDPEATIADEVAHFEDLHPGVRVDATLVGWEEALTKLATATAGGRGPDVTQVGSTWVSGLAETGGFRVFGDDDIVRLGGRDQFVRESWSSTMAPDGATVAVPWMVDARVLYYRTDVLADLDLDPDEAFRDWASFEATLQVIADGTDMYPLGVPGRNDWNVVHNVTPWIWAAGGNVLSEDGTATRLDTDEVLLGVHTFQSLVQRFGHPDLLTSTDDASPELFAQGEFAIAMSGPWFGPILQEEHHDAMPAELWSAAPLPKGPAGRFSFLGGSHLAVFESSQHPEQALELIEFLTARDSQERVAPRTGLLPANTTAVSATGELAEAFQQALSSGRQYPSLPGWLEVETTLQRSLSRMWQNVESARRPLSREEVARILDDAAEEIDAALEAGASRAVD